MEQTTIKSPAKINLYLHITGKDKFNYHLLDTLVCFLPDLHDVITIKEIDSNNHFVETTGMWKNLITGTNVLEYVLKTLDPLLNKKKFHITLEKNIPVGAGLGGGSANVSYLLNYIINQYRLKISQKDKLKVCSTLGADVTLFNYYKALYAMGIGNVIQPVLSFPTQLFALIVYPNKLLSTKEIYRNYIPCFSNNVTHNYCLDIKTLLDLLNRTKNSLYRTSLDFFPELANIIQELSSLKGCLIARMSGSGSTCFGLFKDQKELKLAEILLQKKWPGFFITKSRIQ